MTLTPSSVPTIPATSLTLAAKPRELTPLDGRSLLPSVLIPVYNERNTIEALLDRVHSTPVRKEVISVDDGSTDDVAAFWHILKLSAAR